MTGRALVTGGAGFIGSHVAELYLDRGYDVTVLDDFSSGPRAQVPTGAHLIEADVRSTEAATLVRDARFDVISHLAAQIDVRKSVRDPIFDAAVNAGGTLNLLEAVRASGHATRFVFSSTGGAIYGDYITPPSAEDFEKNPESPYGISKLSAELYLAHYARLHGLDTVSLRYSNVYGPRQDPHGEAGVVAIFCGRVLDGAPLTVYGDGSQTRDYVFVRDVARANLAAAAAPLPDPGPLDARAFNIGTGVETSVNTLAETLFASAHARSRIDYAPHRPGEQQRSAVRIDRAASVLGWIPQTSIADGLRDTYAWFAARRSSQPL